MSSGAPKFPGAGVRIYHEELFGNIVIAILLASRALRGTTKQSSWIATARFAHLVMTVIPQQLLRPTPSNEPAIIGIFVDIQARVFMDFHCALHAAIMSRQGRDHFLMPSTSERSLLLESRHTGERLVIYRARDSRGVEELHLSGTLPARREGPPLHIHAFEDERGQVVSGTLSGSLDGKTMTIGSGGTVHFPKGSAHRWWNAGDDELVFRGIATPAVDLDRFLHALFEVLNAGDSGRPPIFYLSHVLYRHRKTQTTLVMPRIVQSVMLPITVLIGTAIGKYKGNTWPGCPERCVGVPSS